MDSGQRDAPGWSAFCCLLSTDFEVGDGWTNGTFPHLFFFSLPKENLAAFNLASSNSKGSIVIVRVQWIL